MENKKYCCVRYFPNHTEAGEHFHTRDINKVYAFERRQVDCIAFVDQSKCQRPKGCPKEPIPYIYY
jgi:hypothetical protein